MFAQTLPRFAPPNLNLVALRPLPLLPPWPLDPGVRPAGRPAATQHECVRSTRDRHIGGRACVRAERAAATWGGGSAAAR
eukprot:SAG31_NODE_2422_length_5726_cov_2.047450_3_plen_80_part_00